MLEHAYYLSALLLAMLGLAIIDWRYKLALFHDTRTTLVTIAICVGFFALWDIVGIVLHIFSIGDSHYMTGIRLGHNFPLEELFFLTLLCYNTLVAWKGCALLWKDTR